MKKTFLFVCLIVTSFSLTAQDRLYPLDGNATETLHGFNGTLGTGTHTPIATTDRFNNPNSAMYFDGNDFISLVDTTGMNVSEFSISAWVYYPSNPTILRYWFCYGTFGETDQAGGLGPCVFGNGLYFDGYRTLLNWYELFTIGQPPVSQWYHVCGVYSLNYTKFYVNGILIDSSASGNLGPDYGSTPLAFIGSRSDTVGGWIGKIDELHYFDHALSESQVAALVANESNIITGTCYIDLNGNLTQDANESNAAGIYVQSQFSGQSYTSETNGSGFFRILADTGNVQTHVLTMPGYTIHPPLFTSYQSTFGNSDTINFALEPTTGITDAGITIVPVNSAVPGFVSNYDMICQNNGTDTISGTLILILNHGMLYTGSTPPVDSVSGDTLFWNFSGILPLQSLVIHLQLQLAAPPIIDLGDTIRLTAVITTDLPDYNGENNYSHIQQIVIGSHDPNDKTVLEGNEMTLSQVGNGEYLTYVIRFQNTGTASAMNVFVLDTLSPWLDWSTFEMVHSDHTYSLSIKDGNILKWQFNNIMLPDSNSNEAGSHGYICYRIKPLSTIIVGSSIENTANIYFDFNLPVITNTAVTTIILPTNVGNPSDHFAISIYPNPVHDKITVEGKNLNGICRIYNALGGLVFEKQNDGSKLEIPMNEFGSGIYFVNYVDNDNSYYWKIIKE